MPGLDLLADLTGGPSFFLYWVVLAVALAGVVVVVAALFILLTQGREMWATAKAEVAAEARKGEDDVRDR